MADQMFDLQYNDNPSSIAIKNASVIITGATAADPVVITAANDFTDGDVVLIESVGGMVEINDRSFVVASATATTFELTGEDGLLHTAYTTGGTATQKAITPSHMRVTFDDAQPKDQIVLAAMNAFHRLAESLT